MVINVANFFIVLITCFHMAPRCSLVTSKTNINRKYIKVPKRSRKVLTLSEKKKWYLTSLEAVLVFTVLTICAGVQNVTPMKNKGTLYVVITMMVAALKKYTEDWISWYPCFLARGKCIVPYRAGKGWGRSCCNYWRFWRGRQMKTSGEGGPCSNDLLHCSQYGTLRVWNFR